MSLLLQAASSHVPARSATHIIAALDRWREQRLKRRQDNLAMRGAPVQQNLPARLIADISAEHD